MGDSVIFEFGKSVDPEKKWKMESIKDSVRIINNEDGSTCGHKVNVVKMQTYIARDYIKGRSMCPMCEYKTFGAKNWFTKLFDSDDEDETPEKLDDSTCVTSGSGPRKIRNGHELPFNIDSFVMNEETMDKFFANYRAEGISKWNFGWDTDFTKSYGAEFYFLYSKEESNEKQGEKPRVIAWTILVPFPTYNEFHNTFKKFEDDEKKIMGSNYEKTIYVYQHAEEKYLQAYNSNTIYKLAVDPKSACKVELTEDLLYGIALRKSDNGVAYTTIKSSVGMETIDDQCIRMGFRFYDLDSGKSMQFSSIIVCYHLKYSLYALG